MQGTKGENSTRMLDEYDAGSWDVTKGMSEQEVADYYSTWAVNGKYDKDYNPSVYNGPKIAADETAACFTENRDKIRILDVACGSGRVGIELSRHGFKNMDGLDPSEGMLEHCKITNLYKNLYQEFINEDKLPIDEGTYDCLVTSGGMGECHIPCAGLNEMLRITKPGGLLIIAMRKAFLDDIAEYSGRFEPYITKLEQENKLDIVERKEVPNFVFGLDGVVFKLQAKKL